MCIGYVCVAVVSSVCVSLCIIDVLWLCVVCGCLLFVDLPNGLARFHE